MKNQLKLRFLEFFVHFLQKKYCETKKLGSRAYWKCFQVDVNDGPRAFFDTE